SGTSGNAVQGNYIGTNAAGSGALANNVGVEIASGASNNTIGGTTAGAPNVISGNTNDNDHIHQARTDSHKGQGQHNRTHTAGTATLGSAAFQGVLTVNATNTLIGGLTTTPGTGAGNVISGDHTSNVYLAGVGDVVQGNLIGTNATGTMGLSSTIGIVAA